MTLTEIEFVHPFNQERKTLQVEGIARTYVTVRWPMSGIYDLTLAKNVLTARSTGAKRKSACLWIAVDIETVREAVKVHCDKQDLKGIVKAESEAHHASMPTPNPRIAGQK